jgi:hypothetical protein
MYLLEALRVWSVGPENFVIDRRWRAPRTTEAEYRPVGGPRKLTSRALRRL